MDDISFKERYTLLKLYNQHISLEIAFCSQVDKDGICKHKEARIEIQAWLI